jgi:polyisoprenyl-teichoic acid--peptidoglycan teichoic acid transferase
MRRPGYYLFLFLLLTACSPMVVHAADQTLTPIPVEQRLVTNAPHATATATPFQPVFSNGVATDIPGGISTGAPADLPQAVSNSTQTSTPTPAMFPSPRPPTPTPWDSGQDFSTGRKNIMVLGSDFRPGGGFRTDVMMLVSINPQDGTVGVVSFPRDLYIYIPGFDDGRINTAMELGGFNTLAETLQYNFGLTIDNYILVDFNNFVAIVDTLDGVDVQVEEPLQDKCDLKWGHYGICSVKPGKIHMYGQDALWYVRSRHTTNDLDRTRREQEVLLAIFNRLMDEKVVRRAPDFYKLFSSSVETNLNMLDILSLIKAAPAIALKDHIRRYSIGQGQVFDSIAPGGAMVLIPNTPAIEEIIHQAVGGN